MIDYPILGSDPFKKPTNPRSVQETSPPNMWSLGPEALGSPSRFGGTGNDLFGGLTPTMRLNDVEYLLNCSPGDNGIS